MKSKPVFFYDDRVLKKLDPDTIICLEVNRNYTKIFIADSKPVLVRCTLDNALEKLPADEFIKVHRTYAVSIYFIEEINRDHLIVSGQPVPLSKHHYKTLTETLNIIK